MKDLKFSEYPFHLPNGKKISAKLEALVAELKAAKDAKQADVVVKKWNKYMSNVGTDSSVIYVLYTCHTDNKKYKKAQDICDELGPVIGNYSNQFSKLLLDSPYRKELEAKYGTYLFEKLELDFKTFKPEIMNDMIEENKLVSEYDAVLGSAQIEFNGGTYNLSQMGKFSTDKDRNVRKVAAIARDKWLKDHEEKLGDIYDKLVHLRDGIAKKLGYKRFTELAYDRLGRTDYNPEMVANYRKQIYEEVVPVCQKLYKDQAKRINIKNPQAYDYNLKFLSGNPKPAGDTKYLVNAAHKMYSGLGQESKEFFEFMMNHELFDLDARAGKAPGGYCTTFDKYKAPFIFSNFNGTSADVNVLTHEGGHAFQAYLSSNIKVPAYRSPTLESCEIHSMSMEFFAWPYAEEFVGKDANKYKYEHLADAIEFLPYGATVDEFQHWVYDNPNAKPQERNAKFRELQRKYEPHLKFDDTPALDNGDRWLLQSHIFAVPFYYIDYTLAQVCVFQFAVEMNKNHEKTWKKYVKLCKMGGKFPFVTLLNKNHLRVPFEQGNIKKVIKPLIKILKGIDTTGF